MKKIALSLIIISAIFLASCGPKNTGPNNIQGDGQPFGKYSEPITISLVRASDATIESDVLSLYPEEKLSDNRFTELYREKLNINLKYKWIAANPEQYRSRINLSMSIGDLPDLLMVDPTQVKELAEAGMIQDMGPYYEQYASPLLKQITEAEGDAVFKAATVGGKLYGIPQMYSSIDRVQFVWIRMDWLKYLIENKPELGLTLEPKTVDDFLKIARAFNTQDPDNNGRDDTHGFSMQGNFWAAMGGLTGFFNMFDAYPNIWIEKGNKLEHGSIQPEIKNALSVLRQLYSEGVIVQDFAVKGEQAIADEITMNKSGIIFGEQWLCAYPLQSLYNQNNNTEWKAFPLFHNGDNETKVQLSMGTYGWWVVSNSCRHPEALIKMMNVYVQSIWGEDGDFNYYYMPKDTGAPVWKLSPFNPEPPTKNLDAYLAIKRFKEDESSGPLTGEAKAIYDNIQDFSNGNKNKWSWVVGYNPDEAVYEAMNKYYENDMFIYDKFSGPPTKSMPTKYILMNQNTMEVFTRIINGSSPLSEFDSFVTQWKNMGGNDITKEVNEWYYGNS